MSIVIPGIDLGKNSCSVVGLDDDGTVILRRRICAVMGWSLSRQS